jgi:hypothetical protein
VRRKWAPSTAKLVARVEAEKVSATHMWKQLADSSWENVGGEKATGRNTVGEPRLYYAGDHVLVVVKTGCASDNPNAGALQA